MGESRFVADLLRWTSPEEQDGGWSGGVGRGVGSRTLFASSSIFSETFSDPTFDRECRGSVVVQPKSRVIIPAADSWEIR